MLRCPLLLPFVSVFSLACGGTPALMSPDNLPPIEADWAHLTYQVPESAEGFLLASFDETTRRELAETLALIDTVTDASGAVSDVLGIDLTSTDAFDRLGLRPGGGLAFFLAHPYWVALVDLADPEPMREALETMAARNPDLDMSWREVQGLDVLGITPPGSADGAPRLHVTVSDEQAVLLYDAREPANVDRVDTFLSAHRQPVPENVRFSPLFAQAVGQFGGDVWGLYSARIPALLQALGDGAALPVWTGGLDSDGAFGPPPSAQRCDAVRGRFERALPRIDGAIERGRVEGTDGAALEREIQWLRLHIGETYRQRAATLLQPAPIDRDALGANALLAGFVRMDARTLASELSPYADAVQCPAPAKLAGWLGQAGRLFDGRSELGARTDGLVLAALFDLRNSGGMPFADVFVGLGADQPASLSQSVQEILESALELHGTPEVVAGYQSIHYRFALLYRLGLFEGPETLGITLGRVTEDWLTSVLTPPEEPASGFLWLRLDGRAMSPIYDTLMAAARASVEDDEVAATQQVFLEESLAELRRLRHLEIDGSYADGRVLLRLEQHTEP